ncbi:MAG: hypothetical protein IPK19_26385 [Chloroflexi bacterium]|nr:hypothetical protein [Chloroflexota bacterium]
MGTAWFVFDEAAPVGTGIAPYTVCGKTGTAQTGRALSRTAGLSPMPRAGSEIAVVAMIEHGREGSETAAPIERRVLGTLTSTSSGVLSGLVVRRTAMCR